MTVEPPRPDHGASQVDAHAAHADRHVHAFIDQLRRAGVRNVIIAPGSRSTPLTLAVTRQDGFTPWLHLDERSAGYFALGLARETGRPVAVICSSGTAAANLLPAVIEASLSRVPLLLLTADRPPELREIGANQVIDQVRLFGTHTRWFSELPVADGSRALERYARAVAARAVAAATTPEPGPVHVNFPFREPLADPAYASAPAVLAGDTEVLSGAPALDVAAIARLAVELGGRRGLLLCGPESAGLPAEEIAALARTLGWPVLADPLSGLRAWPSEDAPVIEAYDLLTREPAFQQRATPNVVIRFGAALTSKPLNTWLASVPGLQQYVVDGAGGWRDPDALSGVMMHADATRFAADLAAAQPQPAPRDWLAVWVDANAITRAAIRAAVDALDTPFEGRIPLAIAEALPAHSTFVVGNSMPIRDVDTFFPRILTPARLVGTRGASGIDGVISTAAGAAAARHTGEANGRVVLLIGDVSFFHDLNGLWPVGRYGLDLTIVLVHNDGGGIFHFLPQAEAAPDQFEAWFGTPHGLDFTGAIAMHGGTIDHIDDLVMAPGRIAAAMQAGGLRVLQVRTERYSNLRMHRAVAAQVLTAIRAALTAGAPA